MNTISSFSKQRLRRQGWLTCGALAVAMAAGCVSPMSLASPGAALKQSRLEREVARQADKDPFPTPKQAGIR